MDILLFYSNHTHKVCVCLLLDYGLFMPTHEGNTPSRPSKPIWKRLTRFFLFLRTYNSIVKLSQHNSLRHENQRVLSAFKNFSEQFKIYCPLYPNFAIVNKITGFNDITICIDLMNSIYIIAHYSSSFLIII